MTRANTRLYKVNPSDFDPAELDEPAKILREGGIVAFPTETVYGLGVNADDAAAVERLQQLKNRPREKPFSIHIAAAEEVQRYVDNIPAIARTLMSLYWPGPLTIIFPGSVVPGSVVPGSVVPGSAVPGAGHGGQGVGIRFPAHAVACELIRRAGVPVAAPSANLAGGNPATTAEEVVEVFDGKIDAVVDGGRVAIRQASAVVRIDSQDHYKVLREGIITADMIRRAVKGRCILFVCTGNSCRSPMAEGLLKQLLAERLGVPAERLHDKGYHVGSAGIAAFAGGHASQYAIDVMAERGVDISGHRARPMSRALAEEADLIIALSPSHRWQLVQWDRTLADKIEVIRELGVNDPIGGSIEEYRACADEIEQELRFRWVERASSL